MPDLNTAELATIAMRQKVICVCILAYLLAVIAQFLIPPELRLFLGLGALVVALTATVFVFLLATKLHGTVVGIVLGLLTLIPLVGLIVLLMVNGKATRVLKEHGIAVGLLGAKGPIG